MNKKSEGPANILLKNLGNIESKRPLLEVEELEVEQVKEKENKNTEIRVEKQKKPLITPARETINEIKPDIKKEKKKPRGEMRITIYLDRDQVAEFDNIWNEFRSEYLRRTGLRLGNYQIIKALAELGREQYLINKESLREKIFKLLGAK